MAICWGRLSYHRFSQKSLGSRPALEWEGWPRRLSGVLLTIVVTDA